MEVKLANLEKKHKSLVSFVNKTLDLFQSYVEYNQMIVSEFQQLKHMSKVFELDESHSELYESGHYNDSIDYNVPANDQYQANDFPFGNTEAASETINENLERSQNIDDQWETERISLKRERDHDDYIDNYEDEEEFVENSANLMNESSIVQAVNNTVNQTATNELNNYSLLIDCKDTNGDFQCKYCVYKSKRAGDFRAHVRTHTGERPFQCPDCNLDFIQSSHLNRHKKKVHAGQVEVCKTTRRKCKYTCKSAESLTVCPVKAI